MNPTALPITNACLVSTVFRSKSALEAQILLIPSLFESRSHQTPLTPLSMSEKEKRVPARTNCIDRRHGASRSDGACSASKKGRIHFVGIGGHGLSSLALLAIRQGFDVCGSDIVWSSVMDVLKKAGATLYLGHSASNIQQNNESTQPTAVVISSAIPADNVEVLHAKYSGLPVYKRDIWLGKITEQCNLIAISGTHGKSTTAGMLSYVLHAMGDSLIAVLGAHVPQLPEEYIISGCGPNFVLEADEYDGCFLGVTPNVAVVTNVEWDHVDCFKDEESVLKIFKKFVSQIKKGGHLILCGDSAGASALVNNSWQDSISDHESTPKSVLSNHGYRIITYGISSENEWRASSIIRNSRGGQDYVLYHEERLVSEISLQLPGVHNVLNSLAVIATITALVNDRNKIHATINCVRYHLNKFEGISRRFEMIGSVHGCCIYDDYAHHPTEVRAVLQAARQRFPVHELWVVFQPHTFSRLAALMKDFAAALSEADRVIVTEVYAAREANIWNVDGGDLVTLIIGPSSDYIPRMGDVIDKLVLEISSSTSQDIIVLTLGAGDITTLGPVLHSRLRQMPAKLFDMRCDQREDLSQER